MSDEEAHRELLELTTDIVSAFVSNNAITSADLPAVIDSVFERLSGLGVKKPEEPREKAPAVPIKKSVTDAKIFCLECGRGMKMLKRHLKTEHDLDPTAYRAKWGLLVDYPMAAPAYSRTRQALAKQIGLGRKPAQHKKAPRRKPKAVKPEE